MTYEAQEDDAKLAYNAWAYRTGSTIPWEHLSPAEMQGWKDAVEAVLADVEPDPNCHTCERRLYCLKCETQTIAMVRRNMTNAARRLKARIRRGGVDREIQALNDRIAKGATS